tara:strand:- start:210 stop:416 length:207 start_codon:yes stop_codon:yes gene_type:complete
MINWLNKRVKRIDTWDIGLIKGYVAAFILFVITIWPAAMTWVHSVNPWYFLIAAIIFGARPFYRFYIK